MLETARAVLADYPAEISSVQIDNFTLPERYMEAVLLKEEQRQATEKETLLLEQQRIQAQRDVQTAEAERDAAIARADGQAYATKEAAKAEAEAIRVKAEAIRVKAEAIRVKAEAEADGVKAIQDALSANPLFVEYERVKSWNGVLPVTVMGDQPELLMQMPSTLVRQ